MFKRVLIPRFSGKDAHAQNNVYQAVFRPENEASSYNATSDIIRVPQHAHAEVHFPTHTYTHTHTHTHLDIGRRFSGKCHMYYHYRFPWQGLVGEDEATSVWIIHSMFEVSPMT